MFIYIGTLLTLILEALFIVKPMILSNKKYLQKLEEEVSNQTKDLQIFEKIFENSSEGMIITDENKVIINVNNAFKTITGYTKEEVIGRAPSILKSYKQNKKFYTEMWNEIHENGIWSGNIVNKRKDTKEISENLTIMKINHSEKIYYVSVFSDITQNIHYLQELHHLATYDSLTSLLNRKSILNRIKSAIELSLKINKTLALLFIDLDNFKVINDSMGHVVGDALLKECAKRIDHAIGEADALGRIGGDEFIVLLEQVDKQGSEKVVLDKIIEAFEQPFFFNNQSIHIGVSIGIAFFPDSSLDGDESAQNFVKKADLAMYKAKQSGKNQIAYYTNDLVDSVTSKMMIEQQLREAINNNEFELYLQPKVDIQTKNIVGAEALLRWNKDGKVIPPDTFIPIAEESDLIKLIDLWVAQESISILEKIHDSGYRDFSIAVNLSGRSFADEITVDNVLDIIYKSNKTKHIEIEITEGVFVENLVYASKTIKKIKSLGVSVSLDDFGTGYSSFSYLSEMPFDNIKVDRSFISRIHFSKQKTLVEAIIWFSKKLDMKVIAEGVETQEQFDWLKKKQCEYAQGYLFSKPLSLREFRNLI